MKVVVTTGAVRCESSKIVATNKPTSSFFLEARYPSHCSDNSVTALKRKLLVLGNE